VSPAANYNVPTRGRDRCGESRGTGASILGQPGPSTMQHYVLSYRAVLGHRAKLSVQA